VEGEKEMNKLFASLAICFLFVGVSNSFAGQLQRHTWEVGAILSKFTYEEPGIMKEEGFFYGIEGSYTFRNQKDLMIKAEGRYSYGKVDYESTGTGTMDGIDDYIFEIKGLVGNDFPVSGKSTITPYIGLSYRYLNDDSSGKLSSTEASGYERESNYYYIPIGMEIVTELESGWIFGIILEYDYFWKGKQISHLSDVDPGFNDIENDQNDGYGFRGSLIFLWKDEHNEYIIEPFIRYWDINESEWALITYYGVPYAYGYEPANESTEIGLNITIRF